MADPSASPVPDGCVRARRLFAFWFACALVFAPAQRAGAAQVTGSAGRSGGGTEVFLKFGPHDKAVAGGELRGARGWRLRVDEVIGERGRATLVAGRAPGSGELTVGHQAGGGAAAPDPWAFAPSTAPRSAPHLSAADWRALRVRALPVVPSRRTRAQGEDAQTTSGDIALLAIAARDLSRGRTWTFSALHSRLEMPSVGGSALSWAHDAVLRYDGIGATQGGERARRLLAVRRARLGWRTGWGGLGMGRLVMDTGASGRTVDGASAHATIGEWGRVTAWAGTAPDPVSLGLLTDTALFGIGWAGARRSGALQTRWRAGYAGQLVQGLLDPHRVDATVSLDHKELGELDAAATLALGRGNLAGTALAALVVAPVVVSRGWLSLATRRRHGRLYRLRYSFHEPVADRLGARSLPWDVWTGGRSHLLSMDLDHDASTRWWWRPTLHAAWLSSPEAYDGPRVGLALRGGFRGQRWSPHAALHAESGLAFTADGRAAGPTRGGGAWVGTALILSRAWHVDGRVGARWDEVLPVARAAARVRTSLGVRWLHGPWLVALQSGHDSVLAADPTVGQANMDWLDVTLLVRRQLR